MLICLDVNINMLFFQDEKIKFFVLMRPKANVYVIGTHCIAGILIMRLIPSEWHLTLPEFPAGNTGIQGLSGM